MPTEEELATRLRVVAHELRAPLNTVVLSAHMLAPGMDDASCWEYRESILRQARIMSRLLEDLVAVQSSTPSVTLSEVAVAEAMQQAVSSTRWEQEQHQVVTATALGKDVSVYADPVRLQQILTNLIGNACKYSVPGSRVDFTATASDGGVDFVVVDRGVGIAPEFLPRIWEPFTQEDGGFPGCGIGLSLVKLLAEAQGGVAKASSPGKGKGSRFTVSLPLVEKRS